MNFSFIGTDINFCPGARIVDMHITLIQNWKKFKIVFALQWLKQYIPSRKKGVENSTKMIQKWHKKKSESAFQQICWNK
jgi:hypothetical protein